MADEVNINPEENFEEIQDATKEDDTVVIINEDTETVVEEVKKEEKSTFGKKKKDSELNKLKKQLEDMESALCDTKDKAMRMAAEFDNYKKRTAREMESTFANAKCDTIKNILPVLDNFERALSTNVCDNCQSYKEGVELIYKQLTDVLNSMGIEEIKALGEEFNPDYHNAVMHVEDENAKANEIVEVFQKGYKMKDKVLRYSMVRVAN